MVQGTRNDIHICITSVILAADYIISALTWKQRQKLSGLCKSDVTCYVNLLGN